MALASFRPTPSNIYGVERDDLYLVGTSEVPVAALHAQEILEELPPIRRYSTCFRREAGAAGKDTRGCFGSTSSTRSRCSCPACRGLG